MCSGHTQVSIFFVLSGFVLSWGPLKAIRNGRTEELARSLASATFRRWLRLFLPCFAMSLLACFLVYIGWKDDIWGEKPTGNIFAYIWDWAVASEKFASPFSINRHPFDNYHRYDPTMWTIPLEWGGSLLVFLTLLAVARIPQFGKRIAVIIAIATYALLKAQWTFWLFASGMGIADYVQALGGFQGLTESTTLRSRIAWSVVLVFAAYLSGVPEASEHYDRPGYEWTKTMTPSTWMDVEGGPRFWWCWAGLLFVLSASHLSSVRHVFATRFMRFLGRISYMLYLSHRGLRNLIGPPFRRLLYDIFGRESLINDSQDTRPTLHDLVTLVIWIIWTGTIATIAIMVANWLEKLIDAPSTRLAKRVDDWFSAEPSNPKIRSTAGSEQVLPLHIPVREEQVPLMRSETEMTEMAAAPMVSVEGQQNGHVPRHIP